MNSSPITLEGLSSCPEGEQALLRTRMTHAWNDFSEKTGIDDLVLAAYRRNGRAENGPAGQPMAQQRDDLRSLFQAREPDATFDRVCLPESTRQLLLPAVATIQNQHKLFEEWGLNEIKAHESAVLLLCGPPGTGKSIAAHGLASFLWRPILTATTAELEGKYLGDGRKLVSAFFQATREQKAVAFIDEADTLLSRRMAVTQGSERASNSMTSQLLIELEKHRGLVVFAMKLAHNVDSAFRTRVLTIHIPLPDRDMRKKLRELHRPSKLPLKDVNPDSLAEIDGVCGRDVRNAVPLAVSSTVSSGMAWVSSDDIRHSLESITGLNRYS